MLKIILIILALMNPRPQQAKFISDFSSQFLDFTGGNRSGKTYGGAEKGLLFTILNAEGRKVYGLAIEPTLGMTSEILRPKIEMIAEKFKIKLIWREQKHKYILPELHNSEILLRSAEVPQRIEGGEYCWIWVDEPAQCKPGIWQRIITRLNDKQAKYKQIFTTGTPEGLNWYHKELSRLDDVTGKKVHRIIRGSVDEILLNAGQDHIDRLKQNLDPLLLREKLEGEFLNTTSGNAFYSFSEDNIIPIYTFDTAYPLIITCDFNINPCIWNISQIKGNKVFTFDELVMYKANTPAMCEKLHDWLKGKEFYRLIFYGDYTSIKQRSTATSWSDWDIIKSNFKNYPGFETRLKANPKVKDRIEIANSLLYHKRYFITPNCKYLIDDYRRVVWSPNGYELDKKSDTDRTHACDGQGYMLNYEFSFKQSESKII